MIGFRFLFNISLYVFLPVRVFSMDIMEVINLGSSILQIVLQYQRYQSGECGFDEVLDKFPKEKTLVFFDKNLFPQDNVPNVFIPEGNTNTESCIVFFHGCGDNANNFYNATGGLPRFRFDVYFAEYNNFLSLANGNILKNLNKLFEELYSYVKGYKNIIVFGYSLGVNIGALFCEFLLKKNRTCDFIGYKGYEDLMSCISNFCNIDQIFNDFANEYVEIGNILENFIADFKNFGLVKGLKIFLGDNYGNLSKLTNNTNIIGTIIYKTGVKKYLIKLSGDHKYNSNDEETIYSEWLKRKKENPEDNVFLFLYADEDPIVGKGLFNLNNKIDDGDYEIFEPNVSTDDTEKVGEQGPCDYSTHC